MRRFSLLLILVCFVTATHFFVPVVPRLQVVISKPAVEVNRTVGGTFIKIRQEGDAAYVYLSNPKEGIVRAKISLTTEVLYHNYLKEGERLELTLATIQQALDKHPDSVFIGVRNGVVEGMILATTKTAS